MKKTKHFNGYMVIGIVMLLFVACWGHIPVCAQEQEGQEQVRNWNVMIGAGGGALPLS